MNGVFKEVEPGVFAEYRTEYKYWLYHATCGDCEDTEIEKIKAHVKECKDCQDLIIDGARTFPEEGEWERVKK